MGESPEVILSHWYHLLEGTQYSTQEFYTSLEQAITQREIPDVRISRTDYREGGVFSAQREYLSIRRHSKIFDVCAAPFGNGFFVSWWLKETEGCLTHIPFIGFLIQSLRPLTYYKIDTTLMFQESIRLAVLEVIDDITKAKGLRTLSEDERKPIMHSLFK